jgi:hypothetical protein
MAFLGGHNIDFSGSKKDIAQTIGSGLSNFQFENPQFFLDYEQICFEGREYLKSAHANDRWQFSNLSLDGMFGIKEKRKVIAVIGPYGLMLRISNTYLEFMTPIYSRPEWYSQDNSQDVTQWRNYFKQITSLLGGSVALYITQAYLDKYHDFFRDLNISFAEKIETIKNRHGVNNKSFSDYGKNKYPSYFLDTFAGP